MKKIFNGLFFVLGFIGGYQIGRELIEANLAAKWFPIDFTVQGIAIAFNVVVGIFIGFVSLLIVRFIIKRLDSVSKDWVKGLKGMSIPQIAAYVIALIFGFILAALVCSPIYKLNLPDFLKTIFAVLIYFGLGYIALLLINLKYSELENLFKSIAVGIKEKSQLDSNQNQKSKKRTHPVPKVLDTSVIIDGRIFDILNTGFVEGPIIIPVFVLDELQHIADSSDDLKRVRGRRGLDVLNKIQKELPIEIIISEKKYSDITEVDSMLLRLAKELKGKVVTNDYNLNKVAEFQGVEVLNTNDLANAVKSVVIPGEEMNITVLREGKEHNQGIAYLNDGTMVVVEEGKQLIGKKINAVVTSVLQTSAGKMIFVKPQ